MHNHPMVALGWASKENNQLCELLKKNFSNMAKGLYGLWNHNKNRYKKWIQPELKSSNSELWSKFEGKIQSQKIREVISSLAGILIGKYFFKKNAKIFNESIHQFENWLSLTSPVAEKSLFSSILESITSIVEHKINAPSEGGLLFFAAKYNERGIAKYEICNCSENIRRCLNKELTSPVLQRPLMLVALYGKYMPTVMHKSPNNCPWRKILITPFENAVRSGSGFIDIEGQYKGQPYNYGLMVSLSSMEGWTQLLAGKTENDSELLDNYPRWLYWFPGKRDNDAIIVLSGDISSESLNECLNSDHFDINKVTSFFKDAYNGPSIVTLWTPESAQWNFLSWMTIDSFELRKFTEFEDGIPKHKYYNNKISKDFEHTFHLAEHCWQHRNQFSKMTKKDLHKEKSICYPEIIYGDAGWEIYPSITTEKKCICNLRDFGCNITPCKIEEIGEPEFELACIREIKKIISGEDLFGVDWGWKKHILWPLTFAVEDKSVVQGFLLLSTQTPRYVDPSQIKTQSHSLHLGPMHYHMIDSSVDYLEFALSNINIRLKSEDTLRKHLGGFAHSIKSNLSFTRGLEVWAKKILDRLNDLEEIFDTKNCNMHPQAREANYFSFRKAGSILFDYLPLKEKKIKVLWDILQDIAKKYNNIHGDRYRILSLINALKRTQSNRCEWPASKMRENKDIGIDCPFKSAEAWVKRIFDIWKHQFPPFLEDPIRNGINYDSLKKLNFYPGSSLEVILDEVFLNLRKYANKEKQIKFKCEYDTNYTGQKVLLIYSSNYINQSSNKDTSTLQGLNTLDRIVYANTEEYSIRYRKTYNTFTIKIKINMILYENKCQKEGIV